MTVTTIQQEMLALAFSADSDFKNPYMGDCISASACSADIQTRLAVLNEKLSKDWQVIWGPARFSFAILDPNGRHIDNAVFVARDGTTGDYVVAIAGTDLRSLPDWIFEDFMVGATVPWLFETGVTPTPRISLATFTGLTVLLNLSQPCPELPGQGQKLLPFLASIPKDQPINLYTTGHSLGGALSPTLALALQDRRSDWDPTEMATVLPYAFAGPTPGDSAFAAYFASRFPNGLQRLWNKLDVVPHAWDVAHLQEIPDLYGTPAMADMQKLVNGLVAAVQPRDYAPLNDAQPAFSGQQAPTAPASFPVFLAEAAYQHITAYVDGFGIDWNCWGDLPKQPSAA